MICGVCHCFKQICRVCVLKRFLLLKVVLSFVADRFKLFVLTETYKVSSAVSHLSVIVKINVYSCDCINLAVACTSSNAYPVLFSIPYCLG